MVALVPLLAQQRAVHSAVMSVALYFTYLHLVHDGSSFYKSKAIDIQFSQFIHW